MKIKKEYKIIEGRLIMFRDLINEIHRSQIDCDPSDIANNFLKIIEYKNIENPVPIVEIVKNMGFMVKMADELPNNASGIILIAPELEERYHTTKCVLISNKIKYGKRRFVLAHEIGHYLFDYSSQTEARFVHRFIASYNKDTIDEPNERKVNMFAAALLMPEIMFKNKYSEFIEENDLLTTIMRLSEIFQTTTKSVEKRISELGLNGDLC